MAMTTTMVQHHWSGPYGVTRGSNDPQVPSPGLKSAFSPYTDSPSSPAPYSVAFRSMNRASAGSEKDSLAPPPSPYPATVDPSPVESNDSHSTDVTDIDADDVQSPNPADGLKSPDIEIMSPASGMSADDVAPLPQIDTTVEPRGSDDGQPQSVIHAPTGFKQFEKKTPPLRHIRSGSSPSETSEHTAVVSPTTPQSAEAPDDRKQSLRDSAPPLNTAVQPARLGAGATPRASTLQEAEEEWRRRSFLSQKSLEDIAETEDQDRSDSTYTGSSQVGSIGEALRNLNSAEQEIASLKSALSECWTLCNTLANLSSMHRERMFSFTRTNERNVQEQAWKSCWRLCQNLYESRDEDHVEQVKPTLELCRDFCQALFEARFRGDEVTDSILRVSFELNNHLYNTHDRTLPDAFRERTLDFYLTMCHRLMKQRTSLPEETDALLRACWTLAELLFSLRQNNRDSRPVDEELLGSAVQACWELCDLFRDGWAQIRPERGTPKPSKTTFQPNPFPSSLSQSTSSRPESSASGTFHSVNSFPQNAFPPETPTTIYDDREDMSPAEMAVPNILVLGPETSAQPRWSSNNSVYSESQSSQRTARSVSRALQHTPPPAAPQDPEDPNLMRLKTLIVKAALNIGFGRQSPTTLTAFVKTLPSTAFGTQPWQMKLFENYRKLVLNDPTLRGDHRAILPSNRRMTAGEIARAVDWMGREASFAWFRDLFRLVFNFGPEEAAGKKNVAVQI